MRDTTVWLAIAIAGAYVVLAIGAIWDMTRPDRPTDTEDGGFREADPAHAYRLSA